MSKFINTLIQGSGYITPMKVICIFLNYPNQVIYFLNYPFRVFIFLKKTNYSTVLKNSLIPIEVILSTTASSIFASNGPISIL